MLGPVPPSFAAVLLTRLTAWVLRHRGLVWGLVAITLLAAGAGATRTSLSFSSRGFYGTADDGMEAVEVLDQFVGRWGPDDATLLVLAEADDVLLLTRREALHALAQRLRSLPGVTEVVTVGERVPAGIDIASLARSPAVPALLSADGRQTVVVVTLAASSDDLGATVEIVAPVQAAVEAMQGTAGLHLTVAGVPAVRSAFFSLALRDQMILGPAVFVLVGLVLWLVYRRWHAVVVPLVAAALPMAWLVGLMGWALEPIGLLNQAYFTLLPVIAIADAVHYIGRVHEERAPGQNDGVQHDGPASAAPQVAAIERAARGVGVACLLTSITTAAGLLSLVAVDVSILRRFGGWAAVGVGLSWVSVVVVVPLLLASFDARPRSGAPGLASRVSGALASWSVQHRGVVMLASAAVLCAAGWGASRLPVDNRLGDLLDADHPVRRASDTVDTALGGILGVEIELSARTGVVADQRVDAVVAWAQAQPEVRWVASPHVPGLDAVRDEGARVRVTLHTADMGGRAFDALARRVQAHLDTLSGVDTTVTGTSLLAYRGVNRIAGQLRGSLLGLLVVVTLVIALALRRIGLALLVIPVNVLPLLVGGGVLALLGLTLDPLAAVIVAVALGIAVDDTLHMVARTEQERRHGRPPAEAVVVAAHTSGRAIVVSTMALSIGLAVQSLSSFPPLRLLGGLGAVILLAAMLADLTLLPALLGRSRKS